MADSPFLAALAFPQPIPGGGAAAAYGAMAGLALLEKIIRLEGGRPRLEDQASRDWKQALVQVQELAGTFRRFREEDGQAYLDLVRVRDEGGEGEKLRAAILKALEIPRFIMAAGLEALELTAQVGQTCRRHLVSDVMVTGELLAAAVQGAWHIARANLPRLTEASDQETWSEALSLMAKQSESALLRLKELLLSRFTR